MRYVYICRSEDGDPLWMNKKNQDIYSLKEKHANRNALFLTIPISTFITILLRGISLNFTNAIWSYLILGFIGGILIQVIWHIIRIKQLAPINYPIRRYEASKGKLELENQVVLLIVLMILTILLVWLLSDSSYLSYRDIFSLYGASGLIGFIITNTDFIGRLQVYKKILQDNK